MRSALAGSIAVMLCGAGVWAAVSAQPTGDAVGLVEQLRSDDARVRYGATQQIALQRSRTIQALAALVEDAALREQNPDAVLDAIRLLGKMRAAEAADALLEVIAFVPGRDVQPTPRTTTSVNRLGYYGTPLASRSPAAQALIEIGSPVLPAVLRFITRDRLMAWLRAGPEGGRDPDAVLRQVDMESAKLHCCAHVIHRIEGKRRGTIYLQEALAKAESDSARRAIKDVMRTLESLRPLPGESEAPDDK